MPLAETMGIVPVLRRQTLNRLLLLINHNGNSCWEREARDSGKTHDPVSWRIKKGLLWGIRCKLTTERWARHCWAREGHTDGEVSYLKVTAEGGPKGMEKHRHRCLWRNWGRPASLKFSGLRNSRKNRSGMTEVLRIWGPPRSLSFIPRAEGPVGGFRQGC